jgi:hypothetical protein
MIGYAFLLSKGSLTSRLGADGPAQQGYCMRVRSSSCVSLIIAVIVVVRGLSTVYAEDASPFPIVRDGQAVVQVVAAGDDPVLDAAVADLVDYVQRISGAKLPVTKGTEDLPGPTLHIGETAMFDRTAEARKAIKLDGFVIARVGEDAIIAGNIPAGTANGIWTVLQDQFAVRWYYTGPLWEIVPQSKSLSLTIKPNAAGGAYIENPSFYGRRLHGPPPSPEFGRRMRMTQKGVELPYTGTTHVLDKLVNPQKYGDHPDYFAFWDGKRHVEKGVQPCFTHPDMFDVFMKYVREGGSSFGINDNMSACHCERCLAVDGKSEPYNGMWNCSESYFQLIARVAAQTAKEFPDRQLGVMAYQLTDSPPKTVEHIGDNVSVVLCQDTAQYFDPQYKEIDQRMSAEWAKKVGHVGFYDYLGINFWTPRYFPHIVADQMRHLARVGVQGYGTHRSTMIDSSMPMWYLLYQLMWNAELDPDAVISSMMTDLYGKAAEPMGQFYKHWEDCWQRQTKGQWFRGMDNFRGEMQIYTWEDIERGRALLEEAAKLADDAKVRERIGVIRRQYAFTYTSAKAYTVSTNAIDWKPTTNHEDAIAMSNNVVDAWLDWAEQLHVIQSTPDTPLSGWPGKTGWVRMWGFKQQMRDAALAPLVRWACANEEKTDPQRLRFIERTLAGVGILSREQIEDHVTREANATYRKPRADGLRVADVPRVPGRVPLRAADADWDGIAHIDALPWVFHARPADQKLGRYDEPLVQNYIDPPMPDDQSMTWQAAWDDQRLYLRVVVKDQTHVQNQPPADMWKEDSLQIALTPNRDDFERKTTSWGYIWGGYRGNETEFGISLRDKAVQKHVWHSPKPLKDAKAEDLIEAAASRHGDRTVYEAAVQWRLLPGFEPKPRKSFGICLVINDVDQGERRSAEYGSGVIQAKRPTEFAALRLGER